MPPVIATIVCCAGIGGLFWLNRDPAARTSKALWLPVVWLLIASSRPVGEWLAAAGVAVGTTVDSVDKYVEGSAPDRYFFSVLLVLGIIVLAGRKQQVTDLLRTNLPIIVFFVYCAVSVLWSDYSYVAFKRFIRSLGDLAMVLVVLTEYDFYAAVKQLLVRVGFVLVPLSILFIKYYPALGRNYGIWSGATEITGVCEQKNTLGVLCLIFGLGFLWCFLTVYQDRKNPGRRRFLIAYGLSLALTLDVLWMSGSMTSLSCFLLAGLAMFAAMRPSFIRRPVRIHVLLAGMSIAFCAFFLFNLDAVLLPVLGKDPTLTGRTDIWRVLLGIVTNPLLGTGFQSFWLGDRIKKIWDAFPSHGFNEAHNGYLEIFLNLGWIGILLLTLLLVTGYRKIFAAYRREPYLASLWLAYFLAAIIHNLTEAEFRLLSPIWIILLLAIVAATKQRLTEGVYGQFAWSRSSADARPILGETSLIKAEGTRPQSPARIMGLRGSLHAHVSKRGNRTGGEQQPSRWHGLESV